MNQVYKHIKDAILNGSLAPGEKVVETKLAQDLQVSRSPVREAIRLLTTEYLLTERDGAICVFEPSLEDLYELYDLRLALEPIAAANAAHAARDPAIAKQLKQNLLLTGESLYHNQMEKLLHLNSEFHHLIWRLSGNTRFIHVLDNVSQLIQFYCLIVLNINNRRTNIFQEHQEILEAINEGNATRAQVAMREHIEKDLIVIRSYATIKLPSGPMEIVGPREITYFNQEGDFK